ncbi:hypothetical protein PoB_002597900 [Plakobranchus ocellatus]|uniref:Uncharacterized protein n=1 Tax=Plakobranchus ocellatus TaxID=259542 RepID=A0AAV3ZZV7_9GAST|nr:hypothetical protein PoB_002597900 [Plakobranchus ocellatus]
MATKPERPLIPVTNCPKPSVEATRMSKILGAQKGGTASTTVLTATVHYRPRMSPALSQYGSGLGRKINLVRSPSLNFIPLSSAPMTTSARDAHTAKNKTIMKSKVRTTTRASFSHNQAGSGWKELRTALRMSYY